MERLKRSMFEKTTNHSTWRIWIFVGFVILAIIVVIFIMWLFRSPYKSQSMIEWFNDNRNQHIVYNG
jgi:cell division protein FtsW (lipid II flippase)